MEKPMKQLYFETREEWRQWLAANHDKETEVWLVYYKKETGKPSIPYGASVEEALCYGWVDSLIKKLDEERFTRKFTPRKEQSNWSKSNIKRVGRMIAAGQMTEHGLRLVEAAKESGRWDNPVQAPKMDFEMPAELRTALKENPKAQQGYETLTPSQQKRYITWIAIAKRPETRQKRTAEAIKMLERGEQLGLK
jgi:uncharacterized protein YdeI (YjbR/CyaY-like superfamily)